MSQALKVRFINFVGFDVVIFFTARIRLYHSETTPLAAARFVDSTRSPSPLVENPTANPVHARSPHAQAIDIIRRTSREDEPEGEVDGKDATGSHVVIHGLYETRWKSARTREGTWQQLHHQRRRQRESPAKRHRRTPSVTVRRFMPRPSAMRPLPLRRTNSVASCLCHPTGSTRSGRCRLAFMQQLLSPGAHGARRGGTPPPETYARLRFSQRDHLGLHADRGIGRLALLANEGGPGRNGGPGVVIFTLIRKRGTGFLKCCQRSGRRCC